MIDKKIHFNDDFEYPPRATACGLDVCGGMVLAGSWQAVTCKGCLSKKGAGR